MFEKIKKLFTGSTNTSEKRTGSESYFAVIDGQTVELSRLDYLDRGGE